VRSALLSLFAAVALSAPVPKVTPKMEDVYGTPVEASGVTCEMARKGELRVGVSKDLTVGNDQENHLRPLVSKTVEGDFTLTFRVSHTPTKDAEAVGKGETVVSAGVAVASDTDASRSLVVLQRHVKSRDAWKTEEWVSGRHPKGGGGSTLYHDKLEDGPVYFRLTRRGDVFTAWSSDDGRNWSTRGAFTLPGFGAVKVGPVVAHTTNTDHEAVFGEYEIKPFTEEKK